ncbi:hypothetical protein D3C87_76310 [compost metagenome]
MSFFKRLAKLQCKVESSNSEIKVYVYDEEISGSKPIMWLDGDISDLEDLHHLDDDTIMDIVEREGYEETDKILYVGIVNFDDSLFYKLPEKRQNMAGVVLFKNFLKYYKENFSKDSGYWMPVCADFANYELQEKFKAEVDKGTFPPVSKLLLGETSAGEWSSSYYNKENRDYAQELTEQLIDTLKDKGVNFNSNNLVENSSLTNFFNLYDQEITIILEDNEILESFKTESMYVIIENGNVMYNLPLKNSQIEGTIYFTISPGSQQVRYSASLDNDFIQNIVNAEQNLRIVFESMSISSAVGNTIDDVINDAKENAGLLQTASIKRLKKNNSSK